MPWRPYLKPSKPDRCQEIIGLWMPRRRLPARLGARVAPRPSGAVTVANSRELSKPRRCQSNPPTSLIASAEEI
jgi:hypothetical protein